MPVYSSTPKVSETVINEILTQAIDSVSRVEDGRIYFKPDAVQIIDSEINIECPLGYYIKIPSIESGGEELFLTISAGPEVLVYECTSCKTWFSSRPAKCSVCGGTSFQSKLVVP